MTPMTTISAMTPTVTPPVAISVISETQPRRTAAAQVAPGDLQLEPTAHSIDAGSFGAEREQDHVADRRPFRQQHDQPVDAHAQPAGRRHTVLQGSDVVLVELLGSSSPAARQPRLRLESPALVIGSFSSLNAFAISSPCTNSSNRSANAGSPRLGLASGEISIG